MKPHRIMFALALTALLALACSDSNLMRPGGGSLNVTPKDNAEAELAALWLSGELIAPENLYETIMDDLDTIRTEYADSTTLASIEFTPPWVPSELLLGLTAEGKRKVQAGDYPELEALNRRYRATEVDTSSSLWRNYGAARIEFSGRKHPGVLAGGYGALDDVMWVEPNWLVGDWSCVYPWQIDGGMSYLFRYAWGDCPAGCIHSIFWYFRVIDGNIEYVGRWLESWVDPQPEWWAEARAAYRAYRGPFPD